MKTFLILLLVSNFAFASLKNSPRRKVPLTDFHIATKAIELNCDHTMKLVEHQKNDTMAFICSNDLLVKISPVPRLNTYFVFLMENTEKPDYEDLDVKKAVFNFKEGEATKLLALASKMYFKSDEFKANNQNKNGDPGAKKQELTNKWIKN